MKRYILFLLLALFLANPVFAKKQEKFYIQNYVSDITVDNENNYQVKEKMDLFFTQSANGIYRKFPLTEEIIKTNGKAYKRYVNTSFKKENVTDYSGQNLNSERLKIRLGNPEKKIKGKKTYLFDYKLSFEKKSNLQNELYFNIVSTEWNVDVKKVHFKITFPQKINTQKIKFSIGNQTKIKQEERVKFSANEYSIEGDVPNGLKRNEGLVLRVGLSRGYYNYKSLDEQGVVILFGALFLICLVGSLVYIMAHRVKILFKK